MGCYPQPLAARLALEDLTVSNHTPLVPVYKRAPITMARGEGCYLFDDTGKRYLDFGTGIAVNGLGHGHPEVLKALHAQADALWHCSNQFMNAPLHRFAQKIVDAGSFDAAFFCSSGAEANEAAIKFIRRYHAANGTGRHVILSMQNGFHGRTLANISAGGNASAREGFTPLLEGFAQIPLNDIVALEQAIAPQVAGVLIEPVQGEGGVHVAERAYLQAARDLSDKHGLLLWYDEVQCGWGRLGHLFAAEAFGVRSDLSTFAKGIGNGYPLAACLTSQSIADRLTPGSHGSTYGGNPLAMAVGEAVFDVMQQPGFYAQVRERGTQLAKKLAALVMEFPGLFREARGVGLMQGMELAVPARDFAARLRDNGLLVVPAQGEVIRILPPLIVSAQQIDDAIAILRLTAQGS